MRLPGWTHDGGTSRRKGDLGRTAREEAPMRRRVTAWIVVLGLGTGSGALAGSPPLLQTIENPELGITDSSGNDLFANGVVEINADYIAAGAPQDDPRAPVNPVSNAGSV